MTLRVRLVFALVALAAAGLVAFGAATVNLYRSSQLRTLDDQLTNSVGVVSFRLYQSAGLADTGGPDGGPGGRDGGRGPSGGDSSRSEPLAISADYVAELRDYSGATVSSIVPDGLTDTPSLPVTGAVSTASFSDVGSTQGSTQWRVLVTPSGASDGRVVVLAVPMNEVTSSVQRLVVIELVGGTALLVLLAVGSWLVLRHGLRPLESMAQQARAVNAGSLDERVTPADHRSEVGELGLALNTMLDDLEGAFAERDATEARLRRFLADASHELRTPLTSIRGFAELLRLSGATDAMPAARADGVDPATAVRRIEDEAARMGRLVDDLLLLARLDEHRAPRDEAVDLAVLAADACTDAAATPEGRARTLTLDAPQPVPTRGDPDHLRQAVANLVANAMRHTPAGTGVDVAATVVGDDAVLVVRDHGPGLDDDALAHVFERFWQADAARVGEGAGLGLAIVAAVAAEHGGRAEASNHPDGGAEFRLVLPLSPVPAGS